MDQPTSQLQTLKGAAVPVWTLTLHGNLGSTLGHPRATLGHPGHRMEIRGLFGLKVTLGVNTPLVIQGMGA